MARLGVAPHVADKILNHQSGTILGGCSCLPAPRVSRGTQGSPRAMGSPRCHRGNVG
jgi:hypothetical protein